MLTLLFFRIVFSTITLVLPFHELAASHGSSALHAGSAATAPATQPATAEAATTQPASVEPTILDTFSQTRLGQLAQGKKKVSLEEMKDPGFWIDTIRDLVITVATFVPRVLVSAIFLFVFWAVYRGIRRLAVASMNKGHVDESIPEDVVTATRTERACARIRSSKSVPSPSGSIRSRITI